MARSSARRGRLIGVRARAAAAYCVLLGTVALIAGPSASAAPAAQTLRVFSIDVEGGAATLYVTPQGHSLLIDTGWPAGLGGARRKPGDPPAPTTPSSAQRIAAVAHTAGIQMIDYVLLSHYHADHSGGVAELATLMPIGVFVDHGPVREALRENATPAQSATATATLYARYIETVGTHPHRVMKPGETLTLDGMTVTAVDSDRATIDVPVAGYGEAGTHCADAVMAGDLGGEENPRSLGIVATWGKARIMSLGDTTWDVENGLVCPRDLIGPIDLMFVDNHGTGNSNSPPLIDTVRPTIAVVNNGPRKGADAAVLDRLAGSPTIKGVWQLHYADRSPEKNNVDSQIANLDGPDAAYPLEIDVQRDATITVTNPRTGLIKVYARARR